MNLYQHVEALKAWASGDIKWALDATGYRWMSEVTGLKPMTLRRAVNQEGRLEKIVAVHEKLMRAARMLAGQNDL